jgi:Spy/CpxP family protein refolding chaperone
MRTTRLLPLICLASFQLLGGPVHTILAQSPGAAGTPESRLENMRTQLNLSDEQVAKLKPMLEEETGKLKAIKEDASLSDGQKKEQSRGLVTAFREKLGSVLSTEQKARLSEEMQRRTGTALAETAQRLQSLKEKLGLSDEQLEKIKPILAEEGPKLKALKDDKTVSQEDRRSMLKQSMERISAELTPEQRDKMREQLQKKAN